MTRTDPQTVSDIAGDPLAPRMFLFRSLLPIVACVLIAGTFAWGPWVTLALTYVWWRLVTRFG
jgi:hypothetical protein